jgi:hypothetical protein
MQDIDQQDVFFWCHDLQKMLTEEEKQILIEDEQSNDF